jgi:hypothetical protein
MERGRKGKERQERKEGGGERGREEGRKEGRREEGKGREGNWRVRGVERERQQE